MRVNYHCHNRYSSDGRGTTDELVARAVELGFEEICITNHAERLGPNGQWHLDVVEARQRFEQVARDIEAARRRYPDHRILVGAELEYRPEWAELLNQLTASVEFDFLVGSVHLVDGHNISGGGGMGAYFEGKSVEEAYRRYFEVVAKMVEWGGFDVVGHFDLVKRFGTKVYGPYRIEPFADLLRAILERMAARGLGLEVNTSGVVQPPAEPYPGLPILRMAREVGIATVTIGTDSHSPERFDQGWDAGLHLLREAGYEAITLFSRRIRRNAPIGGRA